MSGEHKSNLTYYITGAIVAAVLFAIFMPSVAVWFEVGGEIFLRSLTMLVVPLVMSSVMAGILGLGDVRKLGRPGTAAVTYYVCTTILAVILGLIVVNVIQPGVGVFSQAELDAVAAETKAHMSESGVEETAKDANIGTILKNLVLMLFTTNLFEAASQNQLLPLIAFSIVFAGLLTTLGERVDILKNNIIAINDSLMSFVMLIMNFAPIGIFCLVAARFGKAQMDGNLIQTLASTGWYSLTVLVGLGVHALVTIPLIYWVFTRKNPYIFLHKMAKALLTAFSTASSSATLPVTMETAVEAGVSKKSTEFVVPLGATINMDGTALYEAVAAIFIAQAIGMDLSIAQMAIIAMTATLAAIGAAGIPEAGLVTMVVVLKSVGFLWNMLD